MCYLSSRLCKRPDLAGGRGCVRAVNHQLLITCRVEFPFLSTASALWLIQVSGLAGKGFESKTDPSLPTHKAGMAGDTAVREELAHPPQLALPLGRREGTEQSQDRGGWPVPSVPGPQQVYLSWRAETADTRPRVQYPCGVTYCCLCDFK